MTRLTTSDAVSAADQVSAAPDHSVVGTAIGSERERPILSDVTSSRGPQSVLLTLGAIAVTATFIAVAASYALRQPSVRQDLGLRPAPAREMARAPAPSPSDLDAAGARADRLPEVPQINPVPAQQSPHSSTSAMQALSQPATADNAPPPAIIPPATGGTLASSNSATAPTAPVVTIAPGRDESTAGGSTTSTPGIVDDLPPLNAADLPPLPSSSAPPGAQAQQQAAENDDLATTIGPPVSLLPQGH